jgi:hypothetical protein
VSWISQANRKSSASADTNTVGASLLAKNVNDNAYILEKRVAFEFFASRLAPTESNKNKKGRMSTRGWSCGLAYCRRELAPGGVPTMVVNDDAGLQNTHVALTSFASKLAPTGVLLSYAFAAGRLSSTFHLPPS